MPTFHSIPIHPLLRDRLLQPQQQQQQQQQHHAIGDSDGHQQQLHQQQQQQQQQQKQQPLKSNVAIPRSLLTRDPKDLVDIFAASGPTRSRNRNDHEQRMASILALRSQVALAMISKTRNGTRLLRWQQQKRQQRARRRVRVRERERQENGNREPPPPLVAGGSVSLLEAWGMQQEAAAAAAAGTKTPGRLEILSTGCRDLDELVAFPAEYSFSFSFSFSDGYGEVDLRDGNLPEPEPGSSACAVPVPENAETNTNTNTNMDSTGGGDTVGGLPRGYVLKLSGTTGKTQLALRFAARAATQSLMLASSSRRRSSQQQEGCECRERIRIRYCYSTAGHSGQSLAQRVFHHIETTLQQYQNNNNNNNNNAEGRAHGHGRCEVSSNDVAKSIEFQPIASLAQLVTTIAKLEQEWLKHATTSELQCGEGEQEPSPPPPPPQGEGAQRQRGPGRTGPVSMLVLDALPWMMIEREESERIRSLHRWLKRLARHYSVWIVVVTSTGDGGGSSSSTSASSLYHHAMPSDIHLRLQKQSPTQSSLRLMRHPAKAVTEQDCITILHNSGDGITTPHR